MEEKKDYSKTIAISNAIIAYVAVVSLFLAVIKFFKDIPTIFKINNIILVLTTIVGGAFYVYYRASKKN